MGKTRPSALRAYVDDLDDMPADMLLGRLVLFTITEEKVRRDDVVKLFADLGLDEALLPLENKAIDAFKKATSDTKESYELSRNRHAIVLCRDLIATPSFIRRQITREIRDAKKVQLSYHEAISCTFHRTRGDDQSTARLEIAVQTARLLDEEAPHVRRIAQDIYERYEDYKSYLDSQKIRAMVRTYLRKRLNAIEIKGGVYFVHASHDEELNRLSELVNRLGGGCEMNQLPLMNLAKERAFIVRNFEREAAQSLNDLTREIEEICASRGSVTPAAYGRLQGRYREVLANAEEYMLTLRISQDSTAASAEIAEAALTALAERMVSE